MRDRFIQRGYKESTVRQARIRSEAVSRETLLKSTDQMNKQDNRITFVSEYNTASHAVKSIINKHWGVLKCDAQLKHFTTLPPRFCYKRGRNIRDLVVSSMYKTPALLALLAPAG